MKKRMRNYTMIAILALVMNTLAGCGNDEYIDAMSIDEIVDYAESYGIEATVTPVVDEDEPATEDEAIEDEAVVKDEEVVEDEAVTEDEEAEPVKTDTGGSKTNGSTNGGSKTNGSTNSGTSSGSTTNKPADPTPTPTPSPAPAPTPTPTHTHNWKEHTVTEQVWVPNIVVVDDYEERVVGHVDDVFICNCGYTTTNRDDIANHVKSNVLAGNEGHGNFTIQPGHDVVEVVKVGSHEEDHGHNETKTYVDYYYCDCGERK